MYMLYFLYDRAAKFLYDRAGTVLVLVCVNEYQYTCISANTDMR